jgi:hypothetical protein
MGLYVRIAGRFSGWKLHEGKSTMLTGIWLLIWIMFLFFMLGYGIDRAIVKTPPRRARYSSKRARLAGAKRAIEKTPPRRAWYLQINTKFYQYLVVVLQLAVLTLDQARYAGWIPKTAALHIVLSALETMIGIMIIVLIFGRWVAPAWQRLRKQRRSQRIP